MIFSSRLFQLRVSDGGARPGSSGRGPSPHCGQDTLPRQDTVTHRGRSPHVHTFGVWEETGGPHATLGERASATQMVALAGNQLLFPQHSNKATWGRATWGRAPWLRACCAAQRAGAPFHTLFIPASLVTTSFCLE